MDHVALGENVAGFSLPSPTVPFRSIAAEISDLIGSDQKSPHEKGKIQPSKPPAFSPLKVTTILTFMKIIFLFVYIYHLCISKYSSFAHFLTLHK